MNELILYMSMPFVKNALIVGSLTALCASLLGVILVLKRYSFIGDGLSHVAFGALAIASVLRVTNSMIVVFPITILCAVLILCVNRHSKIKGDALLAMVSVGTLAVGYLLMNIFPTSSNINGDVCGTLFGSTAILTLSKSDVWLCCIMAVIVLLIFIVFYNKIFAITFDEPFASAIGIRVGVYNVFISVVSAIIIVLTMNLAGSLLTSALIVFPAMSAMRIVKTFKKVLIYSGVLSILCAVLGIIFSIIFSAPVGSCIVVADVIAFIICLFIGKLIY